MISVKLSGNLFYARMDYIGSLAQITNCENKITDLTISTKLEILA